jgi:hypothetical protein
VTGEGCGEARAGIPAERNSRSYAKVWGATRTSRFIILLLYRENPMHLNYFLRQRAFFVLDLEEYFFPIPKLQQFFQKHLKYLRMFLNLRN